MPKFSPLPPPPPPAGTQAKDAESRRTFGIPPNHFLAPTGFPQPQPLMQLPRRNRPGSTGTAGVQCVPWSRHRDVRCMHLCVHEMSCMQSMHVQSKHTCDEMLKCTRTYSRFSMIHRSTAHFQQQPNAMKIQPSIRI